MKVLLISSNSSPRGGGEKYLVFMASGLLARGCSVDVLLSDANYMDGWAADLCKCGASVHRLGLVGLRDRKLRFLQSMFAFGQQRKIAAFCRELAPDYILVNQQYDEDSLDYIRGAELAGIAPVASILHLPMTRFKEQRPFGRVRGILLRHWYRKFAPLMLFSSVDSRKEFFDYYRLNFPCEVLLSGVPLNPELPAISKVRARLADTWIDAAAADSAKLPIIGIACQFVPQKNLNTLVEAWKLSNRGGKPLSRLLLIGDGPERPALEERLREVPEALYHITGWGEKYADYLHCLDLFVMPSCYESTPLALVESVGHGTPALIARFNGSTELCAAAKYVSVWDGEQNDADDLARAIRSKLTRLDADRQLGDENRAKYCRFFSPEEMAERFLEILKKMSEKRS